ncbi:MAG: flagellar biosynthesis anti-sigma factor FlgM [Ignavibacteriota bacterium]
MRINDQNGGGNALTQTNGISSAGRADRNTDSKPASTTGSSSDSVQISGFAGQLSKTLQAGSSSRAQRVSEIAQAVRGGTYQVDGSAVSRAMVESTLAMSRGAGAS